ncbi:hypothetical protein GQ600_27904 [Phytophthora cactorum]|nr:hypothetical protein GQ600_27904 [Phytophthora cactorum]
MHSRRKQRTYTVKEKQVAVYSFKMILGYPRSSVSSWSKQAEKLLDFKGQNVKTLKGQGGRSCFLALRPSSRT